jgi:hypothetical protein
VRLERLLTKEVDVVLHGLTIQGVQHGVTRAVSCAGTAVCLTPLAKVKALTAKGALVDLAILSTREGQAVVLKLNHCLGSLTAHVLDCVLVSQPITAFDCVVRVPPPVILSHVTQSGVDASLCCHRVRAGGEELCDAPAQRKEQAVTHSRQVWAGVDHSRSFEPQL